MGSTAYMSCLVMPWDGPMKPWWWEQAEVRHSGPVSVLTPQTSCRVQTCSLLAKGSQLLEYIFMVHEKKDVNPSVKIRLLTSQCPDG